MTVIDAHHHFWWTARRAHRWPEPVGDRLARDFTPDHLAPELKAAGVDGTILIQSLNDGDETLEYLDLARAVPFVRGVVGWIALDEPAAVARRLPQLRDRGPLVGIRHLTIFEPDGRWMLEPAVLKSLAHLADAGLAFEIVAVTSGQYEALVQVAERLPQLRIVIDHLGRPTIPEAGWEPWASLIARVAAHDNIAIKLSAGLDIVMRWRWSTEAMQRYVRHVISIFGADRVMAASNWPVILLAANYQQAWRGIEALISHLSAGERAAVLGGTAERVYGLAPPTGRAQEPRA
jgi:L-fuconolactonase